MIGDDGCRGCHGLILAVGIIIGMRTMSTGTTGTNRG